MSEQIRGFVRSERHLRHFQEWVDSVRNAMPIVLSDGSAPAQEREERECVIRDKLFPHMKTRILGGLVVFSPVQASTQTFLHEILRPSAPAGVVCYTSHQLQGKGRGKNSWISPEGCLTFSFRSAFTDGQSLPFVQYLVSLAIVKAAESVQTVPAGQNPVRIKWPNDIYAKNVKIGGILCQSEYQNNKFNVTTGIGINISNREPTTCLRDVLSTAENLTKEEFLASFLNIYEEMELEFIRHGFAPFMDEYIAHWLHTNQVVQVAANGSSNEVKTAATIKGLTSTGCLLAEDTISGDKLELYPDGNSFDFLSGLIKRKL